MKNKSYRIVTGILLLVWMMVIFSFSAQPATESGKLSGNLCERIVEDTNEVLRLNMTQDKKRVLIEKIEYPIRKAAHMTEYAILGMLSFAFYCGIPKRERITYGMALATAALYACTDEFHQSFIPGRSAEIKDVCIDTTGAAIGLCFLFLVIKVVRKHCQNTNVNLQ